MSRTTGAQPDQLKRRNRDRRSVNIDAMIRDTNRLLSAGGIARSPSWVSREVRSYSRTPMLVPFGVWIAARLAISAEQRRSVARCDPELGYRLGYAGPTGEQAVRDAMRAS